QVDVAGLPGRGGVPPAAVPGLVAALRDEDLDVAGLMAVGLPGPPEGARPGFRELRRLADDLALPVRSMGMTDDLEVALEEGSTMVRLGRALFGERPPRS
ncbi:MAG TPA: alanine racemase, partial [Acidimicrobiales bacterium]